MTQKRYGLVKENTAKFIRFCRDLSKNVFFTALEKTDKDDLGRRFTGPDLIGSMATACPAFMDFVFHYEIFEKEDKKIRALLTDSRNGVIAKGRSTKLNEYEPANLSAIINKLGA